MARGSSRWAAPSLLRAGALPLPPRTLAYTASPAFSSHPPSPGPAGCHLPRPTSPRASVPRSHSSSRRRGAALQGLARRQRCHHPQASSRPAPALTQGPGWAETAQACSGARRRAPRRGNPQRKRSESTRTEGPAQPPCPLPQSPSPRAPGPRGKGGAP